MSIYFGNDTVNDLYIGLTPVTKGYVGTHLFYNGDNTIIDLTYEKYILNTQSSTLYNTAEKPVKSAFLKGNTGCRDIDTGEILEAFEKGRNLELVSVKMPVLTTTGKNIVGNLEKGSIGANGENVNNANDSLYTRTGFILLKKDTTYSFSLNGTKKSFHLYLYDINKNFKEKIGMRNEYTPEVNCYIRLFQMDNINNALYQVEEGTSATTYEPYKSNILTVNEEVTLRGIGDVKDELNCLTGELTERIGEIVLNGSEKEWIYDNRGSTTAICYIPNYFTTPPTNIINDYFSLKNIPKVFWNAGQDYEMFCINDTSLGFRIEKTKLKTLDANGIKEWLSQNNLIIQCDLVTPIIKTVDLTVVDQDNQPTKLGTFENITHVSLEAENLIPEVEMEVATRISEELASASPLMDDISTEQQQLEATIDEQSENVDATMIATTEIFEEIL